MISYLHFHNRTSAAFLKKADAQRLLIGIDVRKRAALQSTTQIRQLWTAAALEIWASVRISRRRVPLHAHTRHIGMQHDHSLDHEAGGEIAAVQAGI